MNDRNDASVVVILLAVLTIVVACGLLTLEAVLVAR
jgi:hypothetical protein